MHFAVIMMTCGLLTLGRYLASPFSAVLCIYRTHQIPIKPSTPSVPSASRHKGTLGHRLLCSSPSAFFTNKRHFIKCLFIRGHLDTIKPEDAVQIFSPKHLVRMSLWQFLDAEKALKVSLNRRIKTFFC